MAMFRIARIPCLLAIAVGVAACAGSDSAPPQGLIDNIPYSIPDAAQGAREDDGGGICSPPEQRDCVIDRGTFQGIHDCAKGVQACEDGQWGPCLEF